jgi:hypothetical protein
LSNFERVSISDDPDLAYEMFGAKQALGQNETEPETRVVATQVHALDEQRISMSPGHYAKSASELTPFRDTQEVVNAMLDKRYTDPEAHAYRFDVKARIALMMREG